jgi:hypothetical protein
MATQSSQTPASIARLALEPGMTRTGGVNRRYPVPADAESIHLELLLPYRPADPSFEVSIRTPAGEDVWMLRGLAGDLQKEHPSVTFLLPLAAVPGSDYIVRLRHKSDGGRYDDVASYGLFMFRQTTRR